MYRCEADVFAPAEGSIWRRPLLRGRRLAGSLAQGMLHRDGPGTEESSPSPLTPGGPPLVMDREVRATKGRPEEARTDAGAVLRPYSTDEGVLRCRKDWRRGSESNRRIKVLQTSPGH